MLAMVAHAVANPRSSHQVEKAHRLVAHHALVMDLGGDPSNGNQ
jgi:hypothetical protein